MSEAATHDVGHVLDLIATRWFRPERIDWPVFRANHLAAAVEASTADEIHAIIERMLAELGDGHSHLIRPGAPTASVARRPTLPSGAMREEVAYLDVPCFVENDDVDPEDFAGQLHSLIAELDAADPLGWVVDLRRNAGEAMWPALAGLGPLLGGSLIGYFRADRSYEWGYLDGAAAIMEHDMCRVDVEPYSLRGVDPKTAVLIGPGTASAGEAACIAFRGRPNARSFGARTAGQSTANVPHKLSDGAILELAASVMADRLGNGDGGSIEPDVVVPSSRDDEKDATWAAALSWIRQADA